MVEPSPAAPAPLLHNATGKRHLPVQLIDPALTGAAALAATAAGFSLIRDRVHAVDGVITLTIAVVLPALLWLANRADRGIFLTPALRVLVLLVFGISTGLLIAHRPAVREVTPVRTERPSLAPAPVAGLTEAQMTVIGQAPYIEGQLRAAREEIGQLRLALNGPEGQKALAQARADAAYYMRLYEQTRMKIGELKKQQPPTTPADESRILARAWNIPLSEVATTKQILERDPAGRNLIEVILRGTPLFGPALASVFGGGGKTRETAVLIVTKLGGGTIPAENDLRDLLAAADDPAALQADLDAIVTAGVARGAIVAPDGAKIRAEIARIASEARSLPTNAVKARSTIARALTNGQPCSIELTMPEFPAFQNKSEQQKVLDATPDGALRACLARYPPMNQLDP